MRFGPLLVLSFFAVAGAAPGDDDLAPVKESALRLYDQGAYEEARSTLRQLDEAKVLDGPMLYRLFFCEKATGHPEEARKALDRAREALEAEVGIRRSLEPSFYLANAYSNLGRTADAQAAAKAMTSAIESGKEKAPSSAISEFQLGKLYQDQGRQTDAERHYKKAVDGFDLAGGRYAGSARWALRYLGNAATARSDFASAEKALSRLTQLGGAEASDWDALAGARTRQGHYGPAAEAWRSAVKADPANADDSRYAARLADMAASVAPLPAESSAGAPFSSMSQADLENALKSKAEEVSASQARAAEAMRASGNATKALDPKLRKELTETLLRARREFAAAGLEYAVKGYGIRETAFRQGYAVLIFQDTAWELPADPEAPPAGSGATGS
jgi:tetratricopeptide (TPR) repeat protein